jgi:hypothetical protein
MPAFLRGPRSNSLTSPLPDWRPARNKLDETPLNVCPQTDSCEGKGEGNVGWVKVEASADDPVDPYQPRAGACPPLPAEISKCLNDRTTCRRLAFCRRWLSDHAARSFAAPPRLTPPETRKSKIPQQRDPKTRRK